MGKIYKPGEFAKIVNRSVQTLRLWDRSGKLPAKRTQSGQRYYVDSDIEIALLLKGSEVTPDRLNIIYCRVSSPKQKADLRRQVDAMENFCIASGFQIDRVVEEIGGGLNYLRPKFLDLVERVERREVGRLIIAHKDRLCRFGFDFAEEFVKRHGGEIIIANQQSMSPQQELVEDLMSVIHSFSCRLYGVRKYKKQIEAQILEKSA